MYQFLVKKNKQYIDCFWHMLTVNFSVKTHAIIQYFTSCPKKMERALLYQVTKLPLIYLCKKEPVLKKTDKCLEPYFEPSPIS